MDFYEVLDQVLGLLRRRGRVTYGALRLQFGLNDEQLAVLKEELIDAQRLASDEQGGILVWTGEADVTPASLAVVATSGKHLYEPALYRLKGEFTLALSAEHHADAEACFHQALDTARRQQAKSLELRAAMEHAHATHMRRHQS